MSRVPGESRVLAGLYIVYISPSDTKSHLDRGRMTLSSFACAHCGKETFATKPWSFADRANSFILTRFSSEDSQRFVWRQALSALNYLREV